jgi:O-methyltransferase involved in polyketide biosynthesis
MAALAERLQTSFWRLESALPESQFRWLTVDLPPIIEVRTLLLPASPQVSVRAHSASVVVVGRSRHARALDYSWVTSLTAEATSFFSRRVGVKGQSSP